MMRRNKRQPQSIVVACTAPAMPMHTGWLILSAMALLVALSTM